MAWEFHWKYVAEHKGCGFSLAWSLLRGWSFRSDFPVMFSAVLRVWGEEGLFPLQKKGACCCSLAHVEQTWRAAGSVERRVLPAKSETGRGRKCFKFKTH